MNARADRCGRRARRWAASRSLRAFLFAAACLPASAPARAQVGAALSLYSDDRFRGYSLSDGHPVAILDLSYDAPSGAYAAVSGTAVANSNGMHPLGLQLNGGYAQRLRSGLTIDAGLVHSDYSRYSGLTAYRSYTEAYVGLAGKTLSSRISFSPRYFGGGAASYAELDGHFPAPLDLTLEAHAGVLVPFYSRRYGGGSSTRYDWQIGVSRALGRFALHAALSGGGPGRAPYVEYPSRHALTVGVSSAL